MYKRQVADFDLDEFIETFHRLVQQFGLIEFGQQQLLDYWKKSDFFALGSKVLVLNGRGQGGESASAVDGVYQGVNEQGQAKIELMVADEKQTTMLLSSGLSSIRKL